MQRIGLEGFGGMDAGGKCKSGLGLGSEGRPTFWHYCCMRVNVNAEHIADAHEIMVSDFYRSLLPLTSTST